jgi:hypothetical protein
VSTKPGELHLRPAGHVPQPHVELSVGSGGLDGGADPPEAQVGGRLAHGLRPGGRSGRDGGREAGARIAVTAADLDAAGLGDAKRVLLRTVNSAGALHAPQRPATWIGLAPDGARLLAQRGVELVGLDFLTLDGPHQTATGWDSHNLVCAAGMLVLEGIDLRDVPAGDYELTALPIPLLDAEGAPGRAFLRPFEA